MAQAIQYTTATDGPSGWLAQIRTALVRYRIYRNTVDELARLSDRDLADLGISRYDIRAIAKGAARDA